MGDFLMLGMLIGGIGGAIKNNKGSEIKDACDAFSDVNKEFLTQVDTWKEAIKEQQTLKDNATGLGQKLANNLANYKAKKDIMHNKYLEEETLTITIISVFILSIIFTFLMRYFNVYGNIWNLIVGK